MLDALCFIDYYVIFATLSAAFAISTLIRHFIRAALPRECRASFDILRQRYADYYADICH